MPNQDESQDDQINWYYAIGQDVFGPIPEDELVEKVEDGKLPQDLMMTEEGKENWRPFTTVVEEIEAAFEKERRQKIRYRLANGHGWGGCLTLIVLVIAAFSLLSRCVEKRFELTAEERSNPKAAGEKLMKIAFGTNLREVQVTELFSETPDKEFSIFVDFNVGDYLTTRLLKSTIERQMKEAYKAIYTSGLPVKVAKMWAYADTVDSFGNVSKIRVYSTTLEAESARQINWENYDLANFDRIWKVDYLHGIFQ